MIAPRVFRPAGHAETGAVPLEDPPDRSPHTAGSDQAHNDAARPDGRDGQGGPARGPGNVWPVWLRSAASVLIILHLVAITAAPWAMPPSSVLAQQFFGFFQPYLNAAYLNHGYHYFAPEPGPGHLIRYELKRDDGRLITGQFPDAVKQTPRLLYHRHFMLSETANRLAVDPGQQAALEALSRSFANHLMAQYSADEATLYLRRHYIPTPDQAASGLPLDAPELFAERPLGTFRREADPPARQASGRIAIDQGTSHPAAAELTGALP